MSGEARVCVADHRHYQRFAAFTSPPTPSGSPRPGCAMLGLAAASVRLVSPSWALNLVDSAQQAAGARQAPNLLLWLLLRLA